MMESVNPAHCNTDDGTLTNFSVNLKTEPIGPPSKRILDGPRRQNQPSINDCC